MRKDWNEIFWRTLQSTIGPILQEGRKTLGDQVQIIERIVCAVKKEISDSLGFKTEWGVFRFKEDRSTIFIPAVFIPGFVSGRKERGASLYGRGAPRPYGMDLFGGTLWPYEISQIHGNLALNEGLNALLTLCAGGTETAFSNANAQIGVGDSDTGAAATQTGLLGGANTCWKGMDSSFPTYGTSQVLVLKSTFGSSDGNFDWHEHSARNGASADKNLNRKVSDQGTKASPQTWVETMTITAA